MESLSHLPEPFICFIGYFELDCPLICLAGVEGGGLIKLQFTAEQSDLS